MNPPKDLVFRLFFGWLAGWKSYLWSLEVLICMRLLTIDVTENLFSTSYITMSPFQVKSFNYWKAPVSLCATMHILTNDGFFTFPFLSTNSSDVCDSCRSLEGPFLQQHRVQPRDRRSGKATRKIQRTGCRWSRVIYKEKSRTGYRWSRVTRKKINRTGYRFRNPKQPPRMYETL